MKKAALKITSIILALITVFAVSTSAFAFGDLVNILAVQASEEMTIQDKIVEVARSKKGYYPSNINEFSTWYYGQETDAYWCSIFVSWCADQVGALETAVPQRALCGSMKKWFERRGQFYPADSDYEPQKGDIAFLNTASDGTDTVHHVEIVTESGFFKSGGRKCFKAIGGNTSNVYFEGSEYVTEKNRPVISDRAVVVGYAHPAYEDSDTIMGYTITFMHDNCPPALMNLYSKLLSLIGKLGF